MASPIILSSSPETEVADDQDRVPELEPSDIMETMSTLQNQLASIRVADFSKPLPRTPPFDQGYVYNVDSFLYTEKKKGMFYSFAAGGSRGLARFLYAYAKRQFDENGEKAYKYFLEDKELQTPILAFLIRTMHPEIVKALICGNLSYRVFSDAEFKGIADRGLQPRTTPGIYFNQVYDCGTIIAANTQETDVGSLRGTGNQGKGLSSDQWQIIKESVLLYTATSDPLSTVFAKEVDHIFEKAHGYRTIDHNKEPEMRRYLNHDLTTKQGVASRKRRIKQFLQALEDQVLNNQGRHTVATSEQAHWSPFEIGYANDTLQRLKAHVGNEQTNWLWGMLNAILATKFRNQFVIKQGQLLYLCDDSHRNLGEALCSVLASSYHDELGCNPQRAGGIGSELYTAPAGYQTNTRALFDPVGDPIARGYHRALAHDQECLNALMMHNEEEREGIVSMSVDKAEERRADILKRADKVFELFKTVQQDQSKKQPLEHFQTG